MNLKYGVIGFGPRCQGLVRAIGNQGDLVVGFDPSPDAQKKLINKGAKVADSFEDVLNFDGLNAIVIGSPPHVHAEQAVASLEKGLHVFSEVPMAINKEDVEKIIEADEANPKAKYMLGENTAFHAEVLFASNLIESGQLGPAVYCETEYLHDVSYRWRGRNVSDYKNSPTHEHWYSKFDPLMYAHAILPAQVAMGGLNKPLEFEEVQSYANDIGADETRDKPVCAPAQCFHVALFKSTTGAIARCASCYVFARHPTRYICTLTGRYGTYESYAKGKTGRLFLADGFNVQRGGRKGSSKKIKKKDLMKVANLFSPHGENQRVINEWINSIKEDRKPKLDSKIAANATMAGIAASVSARTGKTAQIKTYR